MIGTELVIRSILLGAGLAMDAFSVSLADGLGEPDMKRMRKLAVAGTFAVFQFAMPMIGWILVRTAVQTFGALEKFIPWAALLILYYIGGDMIRDGISEIKQKRSASDEGSEDQTERGPLTFGALILQGIATSMDALSVGLTIEAYGAAAAFASSLIIGAVTLAICLGGLEIGRVLGTKLSGKASVLGGIILIIIGTEIWVKGVFL